MLTSSCPEGRFVVLAADHVRPELEPVDPERLDAELAADEADTPPGRCPSSSCTLSLL